MPDRRAAPLGRALEHAVAVRDGEARGSTCSALVRAGVAVRRTSSTASARRRLQRPRPRRPARPPRPVAGYRFATSGQRRRDSLTPRLRRTGRPRSAAPGGAACGRASRASPRGSARFSSFGGDLDRHLLDDREPEALDAGELLRVVRQDPDRRQAEVGEDLVADPVLARVGREAELEVRLDRVEPLLLELVRPQLVQQADAAALLRHVEQHAALLRRDLPRARGRAARRSRSAASGRRRRSGTRSGRARARSRRPRRRRGRARRGACRSAVSRNATAVNSPYSVGSRTAPTRSTSFSVRRRYSIRSATVIIFRPCRSQYGTRSGTRAIVPSSFMISQTTPAGVRPASRARSTAASVWPVALEDAARRGRAAGRRGRAGRGRSAVEVGVDRDLDRAGAVVRRDAGRHALARLDGDGERGAERRLVLVGHLPQAELVAALLGEAEADEAARVRGHEVDRLGRRELRRDREVALVLAVLVVDDDDEAAGADVLDRLLDRRERALGARLGHQAHAPIVSGSSPRRTSRARRPRGSPRRPARSCQRRVARACAARARSRSHRPRARRSSARRRRRRSSPSRRSSGSTSSAPSIARRSPSPSGSTARPCRCRRRGPGRSGRRAARRRAAPARR